MDILFVFQRLKFTKGQAREEKGSSPKRLTFSETRPRKGQENNVLNSQLRSLYFAFVVGDNILTNLLIT